MSHDQWVEAAGDLAMVLWHLENSGIEDISDIRESMQAARCLLEEERNLIGAAHKVSEIADRLKGDPVLSVRLAKYERQLTRRPEVLVRLAQLTSRWIECQAVTERSYPALASALS